MPTARIDVLGAAVVVPVASVGSGGVQRGVECGEACIVRATGCGAAQEMKVGPRVALWGEISNHRGLMGGKPFWPGHPHPMYIPQVRTATRWSVALGAFKLSTTRRLLGRPSSPVAPHWPTATQLATGEYLLLPGWPAGNVTA